MKNHLNGKNKTKTKTDSIQINQGLWILNIYITKPKSEPST